MTQQGLFTTAYASYHTRMLDTLHARYLRSSLQNIPYDALERVFEFLMPNASDYAAMLFPPLPREVDWPHQYILDCSGWFITVYQHKLRVGRHNNTGQVGTIYFIQMPIDYLDNIPRICRECARLIDQCPEYRWSLIKAIKYRLIDSANEILAKVTDHIP